MFCIQRENRAGIQIVHRNVEKPLNLRRVQIHRQNPLNSGLRQQVGDKFRRNWRPRFGAAILAGISEIRDDRSDPRCRGSTQGVGHDQQFHQIVIGRIRRGLDNEHILTTDILVNLDKDLCVVETFHAGFAKLDPFATMKAHPARDAFGKWNVGISGY